MSVPHPHADGGKIDEKAVDAPVEIPPELRLQIAVR
jgi:hypothetical protein